MNLNIKHLCGSTIYYDDLRIRKCRELQSKTKVKSQCSSHPPTDRSNLELPKCFNIALNFSLEYKPIPKKVRHNIELQQKKQQKIIELPPLVKQGQPTLVKKRRSLNLFVI